MTPEEKKLLLIDLCARLPHGVKVDVSRVEEWKELTLTPFILSNYYDDIEKIKPYLRPMSSMTEEEETLFRCELPAIAKTDAHLVAMRMELFLKGHLDFNHLIEKGLALEATEDMYKTE